MTSSPPVQTPRRHRLILVRHARSAPDPQRNPRGWDLTEEGHGSSRRLAALGLFDRAEAFYAGPEPKMVHTLAPAAAARDRQVRQESAFAETHSEGWLGSQEEFTAAVRRFIDVPDHPTAPGWEAAVTARQRFAAGVERLRAEYEPNVSRDRVLPSTIAICTCGRMLAAYLSGLLGWSANDTFTRWQALQMPDLAVLEIAEDGQGQVIIPFGTLVV